MPEGPEVRKCADALHAAWLCTKSELGEPVFSAALCVSLRSLRLMAHFNAEYAEIRRGRREKRSYLGIFVQSHAALSRRVIVSLQARTREARKWLQENEQHILGRRVERVISHGKHLIGYVEGDFFFHSHLMMWGRWHTVGPTLRQRKSIPIELPAKDRRERARIVVKGAAAVLLSAPIFNVGEGDPYEKIEILPTLGPDALPYHGPFDRAEFLRPTTFK